jgi:hypothetical protein
LNVCTEAREVILQEAGDEIDGNGSPVSHTFFDWGFVTTPHCFATLGIQLPSAFEGGNITVRAGQQSSLSWAENSLKAVNYLACYNDCDCSMAPLRSGYRLAIVYSLCTAAVRFVAIRSQYDDRAQSRNCQCCFQYDVGRIEIFISPILPSPAFLAMLLLPTRLLLPVAYSNVDTQQAQEQLAYLIVNPLISDIGVTILLLHRK